MKEEDRAREAFTPAQIGAMIDALNFCLADDWDPSSHAHSPAVYERALAKLSDLHGRVVEGGLRPAFDELQATYEGVDRLARRYERDITEYKSRISELESMLAFATPSPVIETEGSGQHVRDDGTALSHIRGDLKLAERSTDREAVARIIDPDAWHETLPTDGCGQHWMGRRKKALAKADAILALRPVGAENVRERALEEAAMVAQSRAMLIPSIAPEAAIACLEALPDAIRALITPTAGNGENNALGGADAQPALVNEAPAGLALSASIPRVETSDV